MIVFDASGSMAGNMVQGLFSDSRASTRSAKPWTGFAEGRKVPQNRAHHLRPWTLRAMQCPATLQTDPERDRAIMSAVNAINPAGKTPLVEAVKRAADVLHDQGTIVLLTDGEETCGGAPCELGKSLKASGTATHRSCHRLSAQGFQLDGRGKHPRREMSRRANRRPLHHGE